MTVSRNPYKPARRDWRRLDGMTEAQRHAAALSDPDARPLAPGDRKRMKRTPRVRIIRRALGLSRQAFPARLGIPLGALRDWEQLMCQNQSADPIGLFRCKNPARNYALDP